MSIRFPQVGAFVPSFGLVVSAQVSITGYVLLPDYNGASGATVTLKSTGASAVTDATGAFNIDISTEGIAQAPWAILNTSRAWTVYVSVTASGVVTSVSSSNVYDGTVSMNIPVTFAAMPSDVAKFVNWVWDNRQAGGGYLDYCIRWQNATKLTQSYRDKMKAMLALQINAWMDYSRRTTHISTCPSGGPRASTMPALSATGTLSRRW